MLTKDEINKNEALAALPDEVKSAIVTVANEAVQTEVNTAVGRIHADYEKDWAQVIGTDKPQGVKGYAWIKETGAKLKEAADSKKGEKLKSDLEALQAERDSLKAQIEKGDGSEALKSELDRVRGQVEALQTNLSEAKQAAQEAAKGKAELELQYHFTGALSNLKFKEDALSPQARKIIVEAAKRNVLEQYDHTFTNDGELAFRKPGTDLIYHNPKTGNPYTAAELLKEQPGVADILDTGRQQNGTDSGTKTKTGTTGSALTGGWTTQIEAREAIISYLSEQGIARGTQSFQDGLDKAWAENNISELPVQ